MSKVLVTGLLGMIGSWVGEHLLRAGHDVYGIDDCSGGNYDNLPKGARSYRGSTCDWGVVEVQVVHHRPDFVIHCAAFASENLSHNARVFTIENNLVGEAMVRNACINHGVKCMVSLSSIAVMGHQKPPFGDGTEPMPQDPYAITKFAGELDARAAREFHGLNYVVCRPHNCLGLRQNYADKTRNVAAIFIRQALEGKPFTIFGDGNQTRAFSPVATVSQIIAETIDRPDVWNKTFNVGSDRVMSVKALAEMIAAIAEVPCKIEYLPERKEASHAHMIHSTCRKYFGHVLEPDIEDVLAEMIHEARTNGFKPMQDGPAIEVERGLPESWRKK